MIDIVVRPGPKVTDATAAEFLMQLANEAASAGRVDVARVLASTSELLKVALARQISLTFPPAWDPPAMRELASLEGGRDAEEASRGGADHRASAAG